MLTGGLAFGSPLLRVKTGESHRLSELWHIHDSPTYWISVGGQKYMNVKGMDPCYLKIPGREQILFITSNERETEFTYHFVSLEDGKDITMTVHDTGLYDCFGYDDPKHQPSFELIDGSKIVIVVRRPDFSRRYRFDLQARTAVEETGDDGWDKLEDLKAKTPKSTLLLR